MTTEELLIIKFHNFYNSLPKGKDSQGRILKILSHHEYMSQRRLQEIVGIQPGSLSEVLIKLEKLGLIVRKTDRSDKRKQNVSITPAGLKAFEEMHKAHEEESLHYFDALSDEEKKSLLALLDKLVSDEAMKKDFLH